MGVFPRWRSRSHPLPLPAMDALETLEAEITECRRCARLVEWRERVAAEKRAAFRDEEYWGRPVPGFGDPGARLLIVGLAPAAHGANRTGRMFTGDRSGDWLYRALHRAGFANRPASTDRHDGLSLTDAFVSAIVRCAPPANKPTAEEREACRPWLEAEIDMLEHLEVVVALGGMAFAQVLRIYAGRGAPIPRPRPRFGHGVQVDVGSGVTVVASYHPSQQNTFTGRLTEAMLDDVFTRVGDLLDHPPR
ncbi:MAG: uracil-DNA glycosylase [Actinobacteria bacterium]|nr:uracil-DNA glycosylase [Actinomycetota bacterium]